MPIMITNQKKIVKNFMQTVTACLFVFVCGVAFILAVRTGLARLYSEYGSLSGNVSAFELAFQNSMSDPFAHEARGLVLSEQGDYCEAVKSFEMAVKLRPKDYYLWLELAQAREDADDVFSARKDYERAIELAPYYAKPHWQFGNYLLRLGEIENAFKEMRVAAASDPTLFSSLTDMAWGVAQEDVAKAINLTQPQNNSEKLHLAKFLAAHQQTETALHLYRSVSSNISNDERKSLVKELMVQKEYEAAYEVWFGKTFDAPLVSNKSFEQGFDNQEEGFGWRAINWNPAVSFSFDTSKPNDGARSLRVEFKGELSPDAPVLKQIVAVNPDTRYQMVFVSRSQELVSAGGPVISVSDGNDEKKVLATSTQLQMQDKDWKAQTLTFKTDTQTRAVIIALYRQRCSVQPCPIVGRLWLDSFSLRRE